MLPSRPVRKSAQVGVNAQGNPVSGPNKAMYVRKSAQPFGSVSQDVRKHPSVGISPSSIPVNDKDGGRALKTGPQKPGLKAVD